MKKDKKGKIVDSAQSLATQGSAPNHQNRIP
jgi:hypothetical protein